MEIKNNVRRRRQERMKELISDWQAVPPLLDSRSTPIYKEPLNSQSVAGSLPLQTSEDPEEAWKQQNRLWRTQLSNEGYGGDPDSPGWNSGGGWLQSLKTKFILSVIVFGLVWGVFHFNQSWTLPARAFIAKALSEDMDFGAIAAWYEHTFQGTPSFIPIFGSSDAGAEKVNASAALHAPISGVIVQPFAMSLKGIEIAAASDQGGGSVSVKSIDTGRVLQVSQSSKRGITVLIQHTNQYAALYGQLAEANVKANDWVQGGDEIGKVASGDSTQAPKLYFTLQKNDQYIDPADVISFD